MSQPHACPCPVPPHCTSSHAQAEAAAAASSGDGLYSAKLGTAAPKADATDANGTGGIVRVVNSTDMTGLPDDLQTHHVTLRPCTALSAHIHSQAHEYQFVAEGEASRKQGARVCDTAAAPASAARALPSLVAAPPCPAPPLAAGNVTLAVIDLAGNTYTSVSLPAAGPPTAHMHALGTELRAVPLSAPLPSPPAA